MPRLPHSLVSVGCWSLLPSPNWPISTPVCWCLLSILIARSPIRMESKRWLPPRKLYREKCSRLTAFRECQKQTRRLVFLLFFAWSLRFVAVNSIQGLQTTHFHLPSFPDQSKLSTDDTIAHLARGCCNYVVQYAAEASNPARNPITMLTITAICW